MVPHPHAAIGERATRMIEIAQEFLLFRVDAEHGPSVPRVLGPELGEVTELRVAMLKATRRFVLERLPTREAEFVKQNPPQRIDANRKALALQLRHSTRDRAIRPADAVLHG